MRSFDCMSIDSDLDLVCTQQVRAHVCRQSGEKQGGGGDLMDLFIDWRFKLTWTKSIPQVGALCSSQSQALTVTWIWPHWMIVNLQQHHQQQHSKWFKPTVSTNIKICFNGPGLLTANRSHRENNMIHIKKKKNISKMFLTSSWPNECAVVTTAK